jgi:deazaflavin-dependent oxidoreductase (nitroreductase family)
MPDPDATAWEDRLIAEMRANDGEVRSGPLAGHPLLIMISKGAKSREPRRAILTYHKDGNDYVVAGTAGGSPTTPAWVYNVDADSDVTIEVQNRQVGARASVVGDGSERDRLWNDHVAQLPWFADYPSQTGRVIPMIRLTPKAA